MSRWICLFLFWIITSSQLCSAYEIVEDQFTWKVLSPKQQNIQKLKLRLDNGLEVLLISDPNAIQSAAALSVEAGSMMNPEQYPGLAHFLEHMLFLGSEKYPNIDDFFDYIDSNGGSKNAYTSLDHTLYYFDISHSAFIPALDRLAQFFIEPKLDFSAVERELNAVNQEHEKNKDSDLRRMWELSKKQANDQHPFSEYATGSKETLKNVTPGVLRKWYEEHYVPDKMHLSLYSSASLEEMERAVVDIYEFIPQRSFVKGREYPEKLFDSKKASKILWMESINHQRVLNLQWEVPKELALLDDKQAYNIVQRVIGDESPHSLAQQLKNTHWITSLNAGADRLDKDILYLFISMELSQEGLEHVEELLLELDKGIRAFKEQPLKAYIFEESVELAKLRYTFPQGSSGQNQVIGAARDMIYEPLESYPRLTLAPKMMDQEGYKKLLSMMTLDQAYINIWAEPSEIKYELDQQESSLGAFYCEKKLGDLSSLQLTQSIDVGLPPSNQFIPKELSLPEEIEASNQSFLSIPDVIVDEKWGKVLFAADDRYNVPKVFWGIEIKTPVLQSDEVSDLVYKDIFTYLVMKKLDPISYQAAQAGLTLNFYSTKEGIDLKISGFKEKAFSLVDKVLSQLSSLTVSEQDLMSAKDFLSSEYSNYSRGLTVKEGLEWANKVLVKDHIAPWEKREFLDEMTLKKFNDKKITCFNKGYVKALVYGYKDQKEISKQISLMKHLCKAPFLKEEHRLPAMLELESGSTSPALWLKSEFGGSAALLFIQQGPESFDRKALQQILDALIGSEFMSELRTRQQTGYITHAGMMEKEKQLMNLFLVQSTSHHPRDLLSRFELFLENFVKDTSTICDEERFEQIRNSLIEKLSVPPQSLESMGGELFGTYLYYDEDFDRVNKKIEAFKKIDYENFIKYVKVSLSTKNQKRLAILIEGDKSNPSLQYRNVTTVDEVQEQGSYFSIKK
jgi:insulysin